MTIVHPYERLARLSVTSLKKLASGSMSNLTIEVRGPMLWKPLSHNTYKSRRSTLMKERNRTLYLLC